MVGDITDQRTREPMLYTNIILTAILWILAAILGFIVGRFGR